jgi:uncharacterized repeat protein (TIGR02543 family)
MHAQWIQQYTITFETHGGSPVPEEVTADTGTKVPKPADPQKADYRFLGWFDKEIAGTEYTVWDHILSADVTMHAQWVRQHTITFETYGGLPVPGAVTADTGTKVPKPADPKMAGYRFLGWFPTASGGTKHDWPYTLSADVTMHAQWVKQFTITFESHGGSPVEAITADTGAKVPKPADPKKADYWFLGWFNAASGGAPYAWDHELTGDVTMHAQWQPEVSFEVTVQDQDGNILDFDGSTITIFKTGSAERDTGFTATVNGGYEDARWYLNGSPLDGPGISTTINAKDYQTGNYYLGVSVMKGGVYYSTDIYFTVED